MGSASSKFRKHLQSGDEVQALQLYRTNSELRKALDPNCSYGDSHHHETPLHLSARHGMLTLLGIFLFSKGGNPNKTNARKETCLHNVCIESNWQSVHVCKRRSECLNYLLKWRGAKLGESSMEKIDLAAQDEKQNTALHYAAASGLTQCVETLVMHGAPMFVENEDNLTPCDTAERSGHAQIALYLESKMVFSNDEEPPEQEDNVSIPPIEEYSGLRPQDLQEAKDQLLVETADMLSVPLFTAEALLRNHEWSREMLLEAWMTNPVMCCEKCGVTPPSSLFSDKPEVQENLASPLPSPLHSAPLPLDAECDICANTFMIADEPVHMTCTHKFCKECWERYLNVKIQEGDAHHITCPAYDCTMLVPVDIIEGIVSRDMARRYLQFDIKAFVDSNPDMKWCPFPGCGRAVKLPELDGSRGSGNRSKIPSDTSRGVDCGIGHYFCWECLEESHEPCSCSNWSSWFSKISEIRPETCTDLVNGTEQETEFAANCLWLVTNSKPCPNCKSPIQKNEGCNHMKCSKCKYDFCWVCLEQWKWHNSSTGGYFKCNRYEVVKKVEEQNAQLMTEAEMKNKNMQELNRFVHYYTRFKNHENSFKLEEPLLKAVKDKMMKLAEAVTDNATAHAETQFVEDAVQQLLKARRVLKCSYVYGYYLEGPGYKKIVFEFMQNELEECTESLSQMVNRLYLRTPRRKIMDQAYIVKRKRHEFIMAISKGLVPPETPPSVRKNKKKRKMSGEAVDEDLHRAIVASIQEVDAANPWIKDASGRHTNLVALLEWPSEEDSEDDNSEGESDQRAKRESIGKCQRPSCNKVKARNPRTKGLHDYCSRWCMLVDKEVNSDEKNLSQVSMDEHMELLRALEMSRLQYLRDSGLLQETDMPHLIVKESSQSPAHHKTNHRARSNSTGQEAKKKPHSGLSSIEELCIELQRFQELSSGFPKGVSDKEPGPKPSASKSSHRHPRKPSQSSRFEENKSTVVTRVPNKSVEDLYCLDPSVKGPIFGQAHQASKSPSLASQASPLGVVKSMAEGRFSQAESMALSSDFSEDLSPSPGNSGANCKSAGLVGSMFGPIKDLSVSNIHSSENDKTKDFLSKDLASIFSGWDFEDTGELAQAEASPSHQTRFNNLSPCYSPKLSNIRDVPTATLSAKGSCGKGNAGKPLSKSDKCGTKSKLSSCEVSGEDNLIYVEESNRSRKRFLQRSSSTPVDEELAKVGASASERVRSSTGDRMEGIASKKDEEVSLLKMAENLLQMTADVHSRMKAVEKGIRDLEGICDLEANTKIKSSNVDGHDHQYEKPSALSCQEESNASPYFRKDGEARTFEEGLGTDTDDIEQWFDVSEAFMPNSEMSSESEPRHKSCTGGVKFGSLKQTALSSKEHENDTSYAIGESVIALSIEKAGRKASSERVSKSEQSECEEAAVVSQASNESPKKSLLSVSSGKRKYLTSSGDVRAVVVEEGLPSSSLLVSSIQSEELSAHRSLKDKSTSSGSEHNRGIDDKLSSVSLDKRTMLSLSLQLNQPASKSFEPRHSRSTSDQPAYHSSIASQDGARSVSTHGTAIGSSSRDANLGSSAEQQSVTSSLAIHVNVDKVDEATTNCPDQEICANTTTTSNEQEGESGSLVKELDQYWDSIYV